MQFQGRELHIGDKLVSKRKGMIEVSMMHHEVLEAIVHGFTYKWDYEGRYCLFEEEGVDLTWPDASSERAPIPFAQNPQPRPDREAEYRRIWIEVAMRFYCSETDFAEAGEVFELANEFLAEPKKRDGGNNGTD